MDINSINQIREKRDEIRERIKTLNIKNYSGNYGSENEYTFKGLIGGIEALLTDISTLTRAPKKFVKLSTYDERSNILSYLTRIETYLETPINYIGHFELLKVLLRSYNIRSLTDRQIEFESEIEEVRKIKIQLDQTLRESIELIEKIESSTEEHSASVEKGGAKILEINEQLEVINEKKDELESESEELKTLNLSLGGIKKSAEENLESIKDSMNESKSNEKLITSFATKIAEREKRLEELEQRTEANNHSLNQYDEERAGILQEASILIESAKKALNYKTAEGISAAFQNQYDNSNNKYIFGSWIGGAIICLLTTIGLGIWILQTNPTNIGLLIGRISLLPLPIIGAIFCANQYTKQKNIIEDYAYKMVLSKAIVGFSEQLKKNGTENNEEYIHYIKTALEEIHKDPLRKRENITKSKNENSNIREIMDLAEKIAKITKVQ